MKVKTKKDEETGTWQILSLSKYEAETFAENRDCFKDLAEGIITGITIGGANIQINIVD